MVLSFSKEAFVKSQTLQTVLFLPEVCSFLLPDLLLLLIQNVLDQFQEFLLLAVRLEQLE